MGCHIEEYPDYIFCCIGETKGLYGVGFLIKKAWKSNITNFTGISERVALLQLKFEKLNISIIQAYAPTERSSEAEIQNFDADLKKAHTMADENVLVLGDFNAKIGRKKIGESFIKGNYGVGQRNERGERLIDYAFEYRLAIINTYLKKRPIRKWTWESPDKTVKNAIDYIMTNDPKIIKNYEVLNNVKFLTYHRLLRATLLLNQTKKCRINYKKLPSIPKTDDEIKYHVDMLKQDIEGKQGDLTNVQSYYDMLQEAII
ncbi:craniofacial development protein 2-like [Leptidea sinapis]|uniref:craniofacial development protein 2-like n=1 Tax=Leptidea sinapis TaxID=189913 RepID=UPI0021C45E97|nr:craniofacial development protein 2-like [Leptidea sinapis]